MGRKSARNGGAGGHGRVDRVDLEGTYTASTPPAAAATARSTIGAIFVPVLCAFFWKGATWQGALSAIVGGSVVVVTSMALYGFASNRPIIYGLAASLVLFVGVSIVTGQPPREKLERWLADTSAKPTIE